MVETVGTQNPNSILLRQLDQTLGTQQTTGAQQTQTTKGVGTDPQQATNQQQSQGIPQNSKPRITPEAMAQCYDNILKQMASGKDLDVSEVVKQIEALQYTIDQDQMKTQKVGLEGNKKAIDDNVAKQLEKLGDAKKKMEAEKTWETVKNVFMWAALAVSTVAAVATGGALAIVCASLGAAMTILQQSGAQEKIFNAMNASPELRIGITIGISVLLLAGSITNVALLAKGVGQAATTALLPKLLDLMKLSNMANALHSSSTALQVGGSLAGGILKIGEGTSQIGGAVATFEKDGLNKQVKDMQIVSARLKQQQEDIIDELKELLKKLEEGVQSTAQTLKSTDDVTRRLIRPAM